MRVLRIFHAGRNPAHRARDRALLAAGVDVVYVVPRIWPEAGGEGALSAESFPIIEIDVRSPGDVNRHSYADVGAVSRLAVDYQVDLVDLFEEPFSRAAGQLLPRLPAGAPGCHVLRAEPGQALAASVSGLRAQILSASARLLPLFASGGCRVARQGLRRTRRTAAARL